MTATDTARPADLMRQAAREESTETLRQLGGIAALHGFTFRAATTWSVCYCKNGLHDGDRIVQRYEARDMADALRWLRPPGHVIAEDTVTMTGPACEVTA